MDFPSAEKEAVRKLIEKVVDEGEQPVACINPPSAVAENVVKKSDACAVLESTWEATVRQPDVSESVDKPTAVKEPSSCQVSPLSPSLIEQTSAVEISQEISSSRDVSVWTKEAILLRVEKVESEIEQVERELVRLEKAQSGENAAKRDSPEEMLVEDTSEQRDDGPQAMDEDEAEKSAPAPDCREGSPARHPSYTTESVSKLHGESAVPEVVQNLALKSIEGEDGSTSDQVAILEEGELHEERVEGATFTRLSHESESDLSLTSSPTIEADLASGDQMNQLVCLSKSEVEEKAELSRRTIMRDFQAVVCSLMEENKRQAQQASQYFLHLFSQDFFQEGKIYSCPTESPVWKENVESHDLRLEKMVAKLSEQQQCVKFTKRILTMRFRALKDAWRQEQYGGSQMQRGTKPVRRWELEKRNGTSLPCHRSSLRLRPVQSGRSIFSRPFYLAFTIFMYVIWLVDSGVKWEKFCSFSISWVCLIDHIYHLHICLRG